MSKNAIIGDEFGTELPQTQVPVDELAAEKNRAKFSRTQEFQALKQHLEQRITYYQTFLPDGRQLTEAPVNEWGQNWIVANQIIGEFRAVLNAYEQANRVVQEANKRDA